MGININGQDFGGSFEDIIDMARQFSDKIREMAPEMGQMFDSYGHGAHDARTGTGDRRAEAPNAGSFAYPPVNSYTSRDGGLVFEFALAGIDENAISISFEGDYLVLSARVAPRDDDSNADRFSMRGFRPRSIDRQKYRVSAADYAQDQTKAVFRNGVLTVSVPPVQRDGIKIEIIKEGN